MLHLLALINYLLTLIYIFPVMKGKHEEKELIILPQNFVEELKLMSYLEVNILLAAFFDIRNNVVLVKGLVLIISLSMMH